MEMVHFIPPAQRRLALLAAQADFEPVLICGTTGTGKGAIAQWIHLSGPRSARTYMTAHHNTSLAEQIPQAQGGTLLIPEIGEWGLAEQRILLSFLNTKSVPSKAGNDLRLITNTRIMVTTSQSLDGRAQAGMFNAELLEKLNTFRIEMPPLHKRANEFEDIGLGIIGEISKELHKEHLRSLSSAAWERLRSYDWPGNLRELRNVLRLAVLAANGSQIEVQDLPDFGHERMDFRSTRAQFEKIYFQELLKTTSGNLEKLGQLTRLSHEDLVSKLKKFDLSPDNPI
jgi:DNA-binding NtrC family response regulator